jgi:hypothetical protein
MYLLTLRNLVRLGPWTLEYAPTVHSHLPFFRKCLFSLVLGKFGHQEHHLVYVQGPEKTNEATILRWSDVGEFFRVMDGSALSAGFHVGSSVGLDAQSLQPYQINSNQLNRRCPVNGIGANSRRHPPEPWRGPSTIGWRRFACLQAVTTRG